MALIAAIAAARRLARPEREYAPPTRLEMSKESSSSLRIPCRCAPKVAIRRLQGSSLPKAACSALGTELANNAWRNDQSAPRGRSLETWPASEQAHAAHTSPYEHVRYDPLGDMCTYLDTYAGASTEK
eukprot:4112522-Pleurochrysis_carterae.AAC.4